MPYYAAVFVGPAKTWIPELVERAQALRVSGGFEQGTDLWVDLMASLVSQPY